MRAAALVLIASLSGCIAPGGGLHTLPPQRVSQDGYTFDLYFNGQVVHAVRVNQGRPESRRHFQAAFLRAVETGLDCRVLRSTVSGDLVMLTAETVCPK